MGAEMGVKKGGDCVCPPQDKRKHFGIGGTHHRLPAPPNATHGVVLGYYLGYKDEG